MTELTTVATDVPRIYFSDFFGVSPEQLEEYGAFDVSLINDLPLFIDPFLLFNSSRPEYRALHDGIIRYVKFLRDKSIGGAMNDGLLEAWFTFREVKENWLGYSLSGNSGSGLGMDFARALNANLSDIFRDFGGENVTTGSHLEKVCLVSEGVGRDNVSDFVTNLIKGYLLEYTENFAKQHLQPDQVRRVPVQKAAFNYTTETWETRTYTLPFAGRGYVILTPIDMLTKDEVWINRADMVRDYSTITASIPDHQLRAQLNNYFANALAEIQRRDEERKERARRASDPTRKRRASREPTQWQSDEAALETIRAIPAFIDFFIRWKEEHGDVAEAQADQRVRSSERLYISQVRELVARLAAFTGFYGVSGNTREEARERVMFLKDVIENKGGWRFFYEDGVPIRRESDLHILFRLTWCDTVSDVNREVNNGRGPSDFEISRGRFDKSIVEFKLAKNSALARNLAAQAEIYKKASGADHALKVIIFFTREERIKVEALLASLGLSDSPDVILIDARNDNKPSASTATSVKLEG